MNSYPALAYPFGSLRRSPHAIEVDGIVQGFGVVPTSEPRCISSPGRGFGRGRAVAAHLRIQNRALVRDWMEYDRLRCDGVATSLQAGAAATEVMADVLEAAMAGDGRAVKALLELFVNEAIESGAVAV